MACPFLRIMKKAAMPMLEGFTLGVICTLISGAAFWLTNSHLVADITFIALLAIFIGGPLIISKIIYGKFFPGDEDGIQ